MSWCSKSHIGSVFVFNARAYKELTITLYINLWPQVSVQVHPERTPRRYVLSSCTVVFHTGEMQSLPVELTTSTRELLNASSCASLAVAFVGPTM